MSSDVSSTSRVAAPFGAIPVAALVLFLTVGGAVACGAPAGGRVRVTVPPGVTMREAADSLAQRGVIRSATLFRAYAKFTGDDRSVQAGTYELRRGERWGAVLDALTSGRGLVRSLTIPEGFGLTWIVPALARTLDVPAESVWAAARDTALRHELDIPTPTLEGYLFPDTYTFAEGTTALQAVTTLVREFQDRWKPEWDEERRAHGMSRHDIVTLASIVEKEVRRGEERPVVAAVYHNRLRKGMRLQADPTVQYSLGRHTARVLYSDLRVESPYNTYRVAGLPPGPIGSPGTASLQAAIRPAAVPYLYFVAHPDGHHEFRTTFEEHSTAVAAMRRLRDDTARSKSRR